MCSGSLICKNSYLNTDWRSLDIRTQGSESVNGFCIAKSLNNDGYILRCNTSGIVMYDIRALESGLSLYKTEDGGYNWSLIWSTNPNY